MGQKQTVKRRSQGSQSHCPLQGARTNSQEERAGQGGESRMEGTKGAVWAPRSIAMDQ